MSIRDELTTIEGCLRRIEQDRLGYEAEIIALKKEVASLKEKAHQAKEHQEPGARRVSEDCLYCTYRITVLKSLDKETGSGRI
jgi:hypothetical protein